MTTTYQERLGYMTKHGLATPNRFEVLIPIPQALQRKSSNAEQETTNFFDNEAVRLIRTFSGSGQVENMRGLAIMCAKAPIPGKTLSTVENRYNSDYQKNPYGIVYDDNEMVFYVSGDMVEKNILDAWLNLIIDPLTHEVSYLRDFTTNITIHQLDRNDRPVYTVILEEAYPYLVNTMELDNAATNETHRVSVSWNYKRFVSPQNKEKDTGVGSLSQTPLGPYVTPILSNPAVQNALDSLKDKGIDLEGEAVNIYNQVDGILKNTTGTSVNKTVGILESIKSKTQGNDKLSTSQQDELSQIILDAIDQLKG